MNLPRTKAWWRSQAEHRFTLLRANIAARNRYWRWLGKCWDESARREAQVRHLTDAIKRLSTLVVARDERIRELEVCIAEQERVLASSWEERRKAGAEEVRRLREDIEAKEHLLVEREDHIDKLEERLRIVEQENATMTTTIEAISAGITWLDEEP